MELDQAARANKKCNQAAEMGPLAMLLGFGIREKIIASIWKLSESSSLLNESPIYGTLILGCSICIQALHTE